MDTSNAPLRPGVALKTGEDGAFAISANDEEIYDNSQTLDFGPTLRKVVIARLSLTTFPDWRSPT